MQTLSITEQLFERAKSALEQAEKALAAEPKNECRQKVVLHARDKVASIHHLLHDANQE